MHYIKNVFPKNEINKVILRDSIDYMQDLKKRYPKGVFDLVFADPPYNLSKFYSKYEDTKTPEGYIGWCNRWLQGMVDVLRPGGALFVLNIPKWSVYHASFLSNQINFRHWIVWDALSTPAGKFLPAHYTLLYFTKPGGEITNNYEQLKYINHRKYCLRSACIKKRKLNGNDDKELLSDVWKDIHRIKHKKDRDDHPCQLPLKIMERIIQLTTNEGDLVYDPFGGAGTTAIASKLLKRNFVISEVDPKYVEISNRNINKVITTEEGKLEYIRKGIKRKKSDIPKNAFEKEFIQLCIQARRVLFEEELKPNPGVYNLFKTYNGNFLKLRNACKRRLESQRLLIK